ncbi:hypothetical protein [Leclercia pneumoniae]|uniref:hypothetical protein n=1 Tax=Leclercia pneumoniae TaxID=2815358 RepID=UPI0030CB37B5
MNDSLNNKELVAVGHQFAKAMSSDTPIIDMAKMFTRLAERLDCTTAALREMTKERDALAAENAGLKAAAKETLAHWAAAEPGEMEPMMDKCMPSLRVAYCETPATDSFLAEVRAQGVKSLSNAAQSVISERQRQQSVEGWTPEHDDQYSKSQLLWASSCYVLNTIQPFNRIPLDWPWAPEWWKPTNPRRDLVKAGALILAEIERIDRQGAAQ